ncbi:SPO22-domain-containing protein [Sodiomyces alkalinus F11]|uniref:Protein ZIP4 homolog n=1 Tax=Sodiomyces alkalinus (strain CBS 110278 / VKM F-3762 / F11) TaxID=1314773 RepID=A0A3N2PL03_SODAK|nr:SPO22-domain-containing protein [Sodiomyces alkalinus F11]ROT35208.1 SPO22-domain-containing protein [Sodiomyces alkalinus F11]
MFSKPPLPAGRGRTMKQNQPQGESGESGKVKAFLDFCESLKLRLASSRDRPSVEPLLAELVDEIRQLNRLSIKLATKKRLSRDLDNHARELYNACVNTQRAVVPEAVISTRTKLLLQSRHFAFLLMALAHPPAFMNSRELRFGDIVQLFSVGFKVSRLALGASWTAVNALQKVAEYISHLPTLKRDLSSDQVAQCQQLEAEYLILRTALVSWPCIAPIPPLSVSYGRADKVQAWKEDRLDVAEHMYNKTEGLRRVLDRASAEHLAEVLFEMGKDFSIKKDYTMGAKWLDRAYEVINVPELDQLTRDGIELRLVIARTLVNALLHTDIPEDSKVASNVIEHMAVEIGEKPVVLVLRLEVLQQAPAELFDEAAYADILMRMIRTFNFSDAFFRLIDHHIGKLYRRSPTLGCSAMDEWLKSQLIKSQRHEWIQRALLRRVSMAANQEDTGQAIRSLGTLMESLYGSLGKPVDSATAVAAVTLLWNKVNVTYGQEKFDLTEGWLHVAAHELFLNVGPANHAKIGRKSILCSLQRNDCGKAKDVFLALDESARNEPVTRYLMYKVALQTSDTEMAAECLECVSRMASRDPKLLYACMQAAQRVGDRMRAYQAMRLLLERNDDSDQIYRPALLRSSIRCIVGILDAKNERPVCGEDLVEDICRSFETAVQDIGKSPKDAGGRQLYTVKELDWFCKNGYNIGVRHTNDWDLQHLVRILGSCLALHEHYPPDLPSEHAGDITLRSLFCRFIIASAQMAMARVEDNREKQLQAYLAVRYQVAEFDEEFQKGRNSLDEIIATDLLGKLAVLLEFDFEATIGLGNFGELGEVVQKAIDCKSVRTFKAMADCLLKGSVPPRELYPQMRRVINQIWNLERFDCGRLAKYIRCLFQAVLPLEDHLGKQLLREAIDKVKISAESGSPFPSEEIHWLVAVAFNHGVTMYSLGEDEACRSWAELAIELAQYAGDEGKLEEQIRTNYLKLRTSSESGG